jgi:hypothetical protein
VEHRPDPEPGGLHLAKAGLDDPHAFVAESDVGGGERIVVGGEDELAIELLGPMDFVTIDERPTLVIEREIRAEALGGDQPASRLGMIAGKTVDLELQDGEDLVAVALLPFGLLDVQAQDIAPPPLAFADDDLLGAKVRRDLGVPVGARTYRRPCSLSSPDPARTG